MREAYQEELLLNSGLIEDNMCGIGEFVLENGKRTDEQKLGAIMRVIQHREPDGMG